MISISDLFTGYKISAPKKRKRKGERGDLLEYFTMKINIQRMKDGYAPIKISYIAFKVGHLKRLEDLYYLKSICEDAEKRGGIFSKVFFGSIKI